MELFNGRSRNPTLKLASDRAPTRDTALAAAREQRAKRELEQRQRRSAIKIQAVLRGHASRLATTQNFALKAATLCSSDAEGSGVPDTQVRELALLASFATARASTSRSSHGPFAALAADATRLAQRLASAVSRLWSTDQLDLIATHASTAALFAAARTVVQFTARDVDNWRYCLERHLNQHGGSNTSLAVETEQFIAASAMTRSANDPTAVDKGLGWLRTCVGRERLLLPSTLVVLLQSDDGRQSLLAQLGCDSSVVLETFCQLASDNTVRCVDGSLLVKLIRVGVTLRDPRANTALVHLMDANSSVLFAQLQAELVKPTANTTPNSDGAILRWVLEEGLPVLFEAVLPHGDADANFDLEPLNALCRALARPYAAFIAISLKNRSAAVPYISALAYHRFGLIRHLFSAIRATSRQWALKDRSGALVLGYPYMVVLFTHLCRAYLTTSDLEEFQALVGGVESLRFLVHMLRDTVFLALYNGHAGSDPSDTSPMAEASTLFVAASVQLLSMLHAADEPMGLLAPDDWLRRDFRLTAQISVELYDAVASTTKRYQSLTTNDNVSSDSDDDATAGRRGAASASTGATAADSVLRAQRASGENALSVLHLVPFIVPFEIRVEAFGTLLYEDRQHEPYSNRNVTARRGHEFMDTMAAIDLDHPREIMGLVSVRFVDQLGRQESGYGRGVFRDWLRATVENGFNVSVGLFRQDAAKTLEFNPHVNTIVDGSPWPLYTSLGLLLGRAIRDGVLVDVPLSSHVRNLILGRQNTIFDMRAYDAELYRHLKDLKSRRYSAEELDAMGLTFTYVEDVFGQNRETPLKPNGADIPVTQANVVEYVHLLTDFILNRRSTRAVHAFRLGLHAAVPQHWLNFFDSRELLTLFRGQDDEHPLDIADWRSSTEYDGFSDTDPLANFFWSAVATMTPLEQRQLLHFATSATRAPLLGFSQLNPRFKLHASQEDGSHLPTSATCFCLLRIPRYTSVAQAREKLLQAATNCTTFEMS